MERTLSLVMDAENRFSLTLMRGPFYEVDAFTTQFENSEEIRSHFQKEIGAFLEENRDMIARIEARTGKKYRGAIATLETIETGNSFEIRKVDTLYKKHMAIYKNFLYDSEVMNRFIALSESRSRELNVARMTSDYLVRVIRCYHIKTATDKQTMNAWLKKSKDIYYEKIRLMCKAYEALLKEGKKEKSINLLYREYLQQQRLYMQKKNATRKKRIADRQELEKSRQQLLNFKPQTSADDFYIIDGIRYCIDDIPFDLDDLTHMDSEYRPDGIQK